MIQIHESWDEHRAFPISIEKAIKIIAESESDSTIKLFGAIISAMDELQIVDILNSFECLTIYNNKK